MSRIIFEAQIFELGEEAVCFQGEKMMIFFGRDFADAAPELEQYSVMLCDHVLNEAIIPGDAFYIEESAYKVTAVGTVACENLKNLGHCVLVFDGADQAALPGNIHLEAKEMPGLQAGMLVIVIRA